MYTCVSVVHRCFEEGWQVHVLLTLTLVTTRPCPTTTTTAAAAAALPGTVRMRR
jgi:hypothetical protein